MILAFDDLYGSWEYDPDTNMVRQTITVGRPSTRFPLGTWVQLYNTPVVTKGKRVEFLVDPDDRLDGYRQSGNVIRTAVKMQEEVA